MKPCEVGPTVFYSYVQWHNQGGHGRMSRHGQKGKNNALVLVATKFVGTYTLFTFA